MPPDVFVDQFLESQRVVSELKNIFAHRVDIIFMEKNLDGTREKPYFNATDIDALLGKKYNRASLESIAGIAKLTE